MTLRHYGEKINMYIILKKTLTMIQTCNVYFYANIMKNKIYVMFKFALRLQRNFLMDFRCNVSTNYKFKRILYFIESCQIKVNTYTYEQLVGPKMPKISKQLFMLTLPNWSIKPVWHDTKFHRKFCKNDKDRLWSW
jgi:hypothetical protein